MAGAQSTTADLDVDLRQLFASLGRNWLRIVVVALIATGLAFALASLATPKYKAVAKLQIETRESVFTRPAGTNENDKPILDEEGVATEVQIISSPEILKQVATKLDLAKLPEFDEALDMSALERLLVLFGLKGDPFETPAEERVLTAMRDKLNVYGVEKTRVIAIEFSSEDPRLAAEIPNAIANSYIAVKGNAKLESNAAATGFLGPEIADLQQRVKDAEAKVAEFRAQSDLLMGQNNSVLATQQLSELSSELSRVRASRASAEATADSVRKALANGGSLDSMPEVLSSNLIQRLRERQVQLQNQIADLSTTLLDNHPRLRSLRSQLADLDTQIRREAEKVLSGLETEARTAQARENQLIGDLNTLKAESARAGEEQVELNALEREANVQRQQLETYMASYREAAAREGRNYLPVDARLFSPAVTPTEAYFPKIVPIMSAAFVASLLLMGIATLLSELFSGRAMRPASRGAWSEPVMETAMTPTRQPPTPVEAADAGFAVNAANDLALPEDDHSADDDEAAPLEAPVHQSVLGEIDIAMAAEKLIAGGAARAVVVSPEGDEAAATAVLVAREVADAGLRVLLLDLTASGAASRPMLDSTLLPGITNLLASEAQFADVIHSDHYSDCHVVPVGTADPARAMRAADRLPIIMQSLTTAYDLVVVECGPADAQSIKRLVGEGTEVFVSVLEPDDTIAEVAVRLIENGYPDLTLVTPAGRTTPGTPVPGRSAA